MSIGEEVRLNTIIINNYILLKFQYLSFQPALLFIFYFFSMSLFSVLPSFSSLHFLFVSLFYVHECSYSFDSSGSRSFRLWSNVK